MKPHTSLFQAGKKHQDIRLSPLDVAENRICMKRVMIFGYRINEEVLLQGLRLAARDFPLICGRLKKVNTQHFIRCDDKGLTLGIIYKNQLMPAYGFDHPVKRELKKYLMPLNLSAYNKEDSLVAIKITYFSDGMIIGVSNLHQLIDGYGAWKIIRNWSDYCRNPQRSNENIDLSRDTFI